MRGPTKTERPGCRESKAATRTSAGDSPRMARGPLRRAPDHRRGQDGDGVGTADTAGLLSMTAASAHAWRVANTIRRGA